MTRINIVPPAEICDQQLIAEWRELTRIPNGIVAGKYIVDLKQIPERYTVRTEDNPDGGKGHMKFFFNKLKFLHRRYQAIMDELAQRGMPRRSMWPVDSLNIWSLQGLWGDYEPTPEAIALNRKRITEKFPKKARYAGEYL